MFLKRLYSEPPGLFRSGKSEHPDTVVFKDGFNFIFGKKDSSESKEPLNGIGKSSLADLIDFCLLADFGSKNKRLYKEKDRLKGYKIILEFEVNGVDYIIKRSATDKKMWKSGFCTRKKKFLSEMQRQDSFRPFLKTLITKALQMKGGTEA